MPKYNRIFTIVIDSLGTGAMPDSEKFGLIKYYCLILIRQHLTLDMLLNGTREDDFLQILAFVHQVLHSIFMSDKMCIRDSLYC